MKPMETFLWQFREDLKDAEGGISAPGIISHENQILVQGKDQRDFQILATLTEYHNEVVRDLWKNLYNI